ncbi:MmsAB operon regulatory protein [Salinisphaera shabanensis E1L3A]|uniref:MmsAB operon regulatory protein n=1 Tax=Salinisphaera shabanensis E1L3A TaxID=1033802 RepID=U2G1C4_9GAMM|nr:AraC family transcriptional regulator [Salinisphaera shabanensis]ERJ20028.1 MmsAB operon regulatory protein [Salinisphaera shabanensis E1L3A]
MNLAPRIPAYAGIETSRWPLPETGRRVILPQKLVDEMAANPLCRDCLPHGVGYYPRAAGHRMGRRNPRDHLLIYCLSGAGVARREGRRQAVQAGDVLLLREGERHSYCADRHEPWSIYWAHLGGHAVARFFDEIAAGHDDFVVPVGLHPRLTEDLNLLLTVADRFKSQHFVYAANLLQSILSFMALVHHQHRDRGAALDIDRVQAWLQAHLHERIDLDELVTATSTISRYHFIREYRRQTGQTPMQAFQRLKISRACYLLDITDWNVGEIASDLGYDDPYYFSRLFKKVMGVPPRDYRREHQAG